jgi:RimJ/RimL family protein N-acetyltransferase
MVVIRDWLARSADGELVARAFVVRFEADTNQHLRECGIDVLPAHRRKGIGKQLLREIVAGAGDEDDIVLGFFTSDRVPAAAAFLERIGAKTTLTMHTNQLDLSTLDRDMVREWAASMPTDTASNGSTAIFLTTKCRTSSSRTTP